MLAAVIVIQFVMVICPSVFSFEVRADEEITIDITSDLPASNINSGDIITVSVSASNVNHITRFGPITLSYDASCLDYLSVSQPTSLSAFTYNIDSTEAGYISISAVNESVETDINIAELSGEEFEDNSFSSEEVVLFNISFRVLPTSCDNAYVSIDDASGFINSSHEEIATIVNNGRIEFEVTAEPSSDANIAFLSINGYTLTPEFSPSVYEYSISVGRDVNSIQVTATPVNLWALVEIYGNSSLQEGDNIIRVEVTAQDGVTHNTYTIHANKQESYNTEGAGMLDKDGIFYTFVAFPTEYTVPEGFTETTRTINGYSVPVFANGGVESLLVYVSDGSEAPDFYFYNPSTQTVTRYAPVSTVVISSRILFKSEVPEDVKIPEGFSSTVLYVKGEEISGYVNDSGLFICYMVDENGFGNFYRYNFDSGIFTEYVEAGRTGFQLYRFLFHLFLFATAIETIFIITIVFIVRSNIVKRRNPRPKRV